MSFLDRMLLTDIMSVVLVRGRDYEDTPIFAYVAVPGSNLKEFYDAMGQGDFDPEEHGGIMITSGEGEPNGDTREFIESQYGFNHGESTTHRQLQAVH